jgi:hypothetical protein
MMGDPAHFVTLKAWCPDHSLLILEPFANSTTDWKSVEARVFWEAAEIMIGTDITQKVFEMEYFIPFAPS